MSVTCGNSLILWAASPLMLLELIKPCTELLRSV